jgi:hypothetical protein
MKKLALVAALAATVMLLPLEPAGAGSGHSIEVSKTVVGQGGSGPYTIVVDCTQSGTLDFVVPADDLVEQLVGAFVETCTVSEPDTQGAQVSYACIGTVGAATCGANGAFSFSSDGFATVQLEVTNTFGGAGTTTTTGPGATTTTTIRPATAPTAAAVTTTPAFTG